MNELEFGNALIRLKVKMSVGVPCAQRNVINDFVGPENMRKAQQYPQRMNDYVELCRQLLDQSCRAENFGLRSAGR
jgi:hypothetical protein